MVKMSVTFPMNMYLVLVVAVDPLPQDLIHLNQLPSHLLMVLGQSIIGPVMNLHHAAPPREDSL
jgi:hypothetical protein